jgi:hypothetical protein
VSVDECHTMRQCACMHCHINILCKRRLGVMTCMCPRSARPLAKCWCCLMAMRIGNQEYMWQRMLCWRSCCHWINRMRYT